MGTEEGEFLVIGAGISGLLIARQLHEAGRGVRVLEKGRGYGGRMATRRDGEARFDHGAQFFTVRDPRFQAWVDRWVEAGVVREWFRNSPGESGGDGHPRYVGAEGISDVGKWLGEGLDVRRGTKATRVRRTGSTWRVEVEDGTLFLAKQLIVTAPVPQSLELLADCGVEFAGEAGERLRAVRYEKGLSVMARLDGPSGLAGAGGVKAEEGPLSWLGDNQKKGISQVSAVTLHSDAAFAEAHWESPDDVRGPLLLEAARLYLEAEVISYKCHRWGYAKPTRTFGAPFFHERQSQLLLAGDSFGGARVEGAAISGIEAGTFLLG